MEKLYKVLHEDGRPFHGGVGRWSLPKNGNPGDWMPPIEGELIACRNGYHLCRIQDLAQWLGPTIWEVECRGERLDCDDKVVVREARLLSKTAWNERTARLFAADCAERVLPIYGRARDDNRPRNAIEVARRFANGLATKEELTAAWAAAWDAAGATAGDAAGAAARDAAWDAEREWQLERLLQVIKGEETDANPD